MLLQKIVKNKILLTIFLTIFIVGIVFIISPFLYVINKTIQNKYYHIKNTLFSTTTPKSIVVLEIDEKTLLALGRFPFDRKVYAPVIEHLTAAQSAVIGFDIIFSDTTNRQSDTALFEAIQKSGRVIVGTTILDDGKGKKYGELLPGIEASILGKGYFPPLIDAKNNITYSLEPIKQFSNGTTLDHFSLALLKAYYHRVFSETMDPSSFFEDGFLLHGTKIPFSSFGRKEMLINFLPSYKYQRFSFSDVYDDKIFPSIQDKFKDKIVLIGTASKGIKDIFTTPNGVEFGVYIHANALQTILGKNFFVYFDKKLEWALIFFLVSISVYFNLSRSSFVLVLSNIALLSIFLLILPITIIVFTNIIINYPTEIILALIISLTMSNTVKYLIENKERNKLNKALSEYVSKDIAKEILSGEGKVKLDGEKKKIAIFFSDIEGFTTISEKFTPEKLLSFLREYLQVMSNVIIDDKGFINKYEGDAIMALWGVFGFADTMERDMCNTAILQQKLLGILNKKWVKQGVPEIKIRIGLHAGDAIIGNIGAEGRKLEFTALGDSVNLASRLEGVNKFYGTRICASEAIYTKVQDEFEFRYLDTIRVKGKKQAMNIYELLGEKGKVQAEILDRMSEFGRAIELYTKIDFMGAKKIFSVLMKEGDMPSKTYLERIEYYTKNPPKGDFDGVWEFMEK